MVTNAPRDFTWNDCETVFRELHAQGIDPIVVGGQAVNLWLDYYGADIQALAAPVASKDLDVIGDQDLAQRCSDVLHARYIPINRTKSAVPMNAIVSLGDDEHALKIDFQDGSEPNTIDELQAAAVRLPTAWGTVCVMHPLHCLKTRVHNVLEIWHKGEKKYANDHGRAQMRAAMVIFRHFAQELAGKDGGPRKVIKNYESLFEFALEGAGEKLWFKERVNLIDCIEPHQELPEMFRTVRYPQMCARFARQD